MPVVFDWVTEWVTLGFPWLRGLLLYLATMRTIQFGLLVKSHPGFPCLLCYRGYLRSSSVTDATTLVLIWIELSWLRYSLLWECIFFSMARQPLGGLGRLIFRGFTITHFLDTPHSVGLLWTRDQLVAETSTWQHTTLTRDRHPCPRQDSNPQSR
jgi:hypothetical protein